MVKQSMVNNYPNRAILLMHHQQQQQYLGRKSILMSIMSECFCLSSELMTSEMYIHDWNPIALPRCSVTRFGDLLDYGQLFKAIGNN